MKADQEIWTEEEEHLLEHAEEYLAILRRGTTKDLENFMHRANMNHGYPIQFGDNFTFQKTGDEVAKRAVEVVKGFHNKIEELKKSVADICKRREIDFSAALEEAGDVIDVHEDISSSRAYSNVASAMNAVGAKKVIEEMNKDINAVKTAAQSIVSHQAQIAELERLTRNIDPKKKFDLSWTDLVRLGF